MRYYHIVLVITFVVALVNNSMSNVDILLHWISLLLMLYITGKYSLFKHLGKYVVLLTFWMSLMFMPAFHLVKNLAGEEGTRGYVITPLDYERILSFGSKVLLITCLAWLLIAAFSKKKTNGPVSYTPKLLSKTIVDAAFAIMFLLSLFSLAIGLSRMGAQGIRLPFHLGGVITLLRLSFFPLFFAIIVENYILCGKIIPRYYFILFFIWALFEVFVRLSKSALVGSFLPVGLVLFFYYRPSLRSLAKYLIPFFALFLFLYPIVEVMRSTEEGSLLESFSVATKEVDSQNESDNPFIQPLNRSFMIPSYYAKDYNWVNHDRLFDFSKAPILFAWGGAARYQTFVIDGYPLGVAHSSGTTALEDPLLHGGYGLCYIIIFLLVAMGNGIDSMAHRKMNTIYIALVLLLWGFSNTQNITSMYDAVSMQYMIARFFAIWVAYQVNFKRQSVS